MPQPPHNADGWVCVKPGTQGDYKELDSHGVPNLPPLTATCDGTANVWLSGRTTVLDVGMHLKIGGTRSRVVARSSDHTSLEMRDGRTRWRPRAYPSASSTPNSRPSSAFSGKPDK